MNQLLFEKLGISPTASKVYLALLDVGKASADKIAKKAGTYKANTYEALEKLTEKGLVSSLREENKRFFIPTNPEKLPQLIEDQKERECIQLEELKKDIQKIMPSLQARYNSIKEKELFEIYRGRKAVKALMNEIVKEHPSIWKGFGNLQVQEYFPIEFQKWFHHVTIHLFSTKSKDVLKRLQEASKTTKVEIIWLPQEIYMPIVWVVFGNNVLIIIYEPDLIILRIKSEQVIKTFFHQFDYLWKKYNA